MFVWVRSVRFSCDSDDYMFSSDCATVNYFRVSAIHFNKRTMHSSHECVCVRQKHWAEKYFRCHHYISDSNDRIAHNVYSVKCVRQWIQDDVLIWCALRFIVNAQFRPLNAIQGKSLEKKNALLRISTDQMANVIRKICNKFSKILSVHRWHDGPVPVVQIKF